MSMIDWVAEGFYEVQMHPNDSTSSLEEYLISTLSLFLPASANRCMSDSSFDVSHKTQTHTQPLAISPSDYRRASR